MLSIGKLVAGQERYYEQQVELGRDDYYAGRGEATGRWTGSGADETGVEKKTGAVRVRVDERYFRPAEVDILLGDASKAKRELGWSPKVTFEGLVNMMADADLEKARQESGAVRPV